MFRVREGPIDVKTALSEPGFDADGLFKLAAESLPSGVLVVAGDGTIVFVNAEVERQCRYTREELVGQPVEIVLPKALPRASQMGAGRELFGRRSDGSEFPVEIGLNPIETPHGTFVLATMVDLTARKPVDGATGVTVEDQLEFERLVAESSATFINVPADRVGDAIRDALRRIGEALDLDWCTFCRVQPDGLPIDPVSWAGPGFPPTPAPVAAGTSFPCALKTVRAGQVVCFSSVDEIPDPVDREHYRSKGVRSAVTVPLSVGGEIIGAVGFNLLREQRSWDPETVHRLRVIATAFGNVLARRNADEALAKALAEVERLRDQLHAENVCLRREAQERLGTGPIAGDSPAVRRVLEQVRQVAATDSTVLLLGETGTGKELFATQTHEQSVRRARTMVRVNCAAIPETLMESELFGREKGAFTGALARQAGRFELADHSTIFLDEIGDLPGDVQVKLLRVLEERQIERLGSPKPIHVDVRVIAATHRNLEQRIANGAFREDLYYRLNVFPIQVPPLRERVEDIPLLVWRFVEEFSRTSGKRIEAIPRETMAALQQYSWPGNIRELRNVVERAMIVATGPRLTIALPATKMAPGKRGLKLVDVEQEHIRHVLESTHWRIRGAGGAADRLGLRPTTLETRMAKLGIKRPHL
jgi:formate hydrogenlyase transcriptional activator